MAYCTDNELKAWLQFNDTEDDTLLPGIIDSASEWIDEWCGQFFTATTQTRTFAACSGDELVLGHAAPLVAVTTLKTDEDGDGTFETTWDAADYQLLPFDAPSHSPARPYRTVRAVGSRSFPVAYDPRGRSNRVQIVGSFGWAEVPAKVRDACLILAASEYKRRYSPEGVAGFGEFGAIRISGRVDPDVARLLKRYQAPLVA